MEGPTRLPAVPEALATQLHAAGNAGEYGFTPGQFRNLLQEVAEKYAPTAKSAAKLEEFVRGLRVEELALARGCAAGNEKAWEVFLTRFRERLYGAARQIAREESAARDLADSVYGDLFASRVNGAVRVSKLSSYGGRGSLEGWLRTVLAQEWINRFRKNKRLVSLDEEVEKGIQFEAAAEPENVPAPLAQLAGATDKALAELSGEDRFVLASYFLDERTLAEVAKTLKVHESTISRRLEKLARAVRGRILDHLVLGGLSKRQAEEALEVDVRDLGMDLRARLQAQKLQGPAERY